jgi:hypothetical protein
MFTNTESPVPQDDVLVLFDYAKTLLDLHQDDNVEFWRSVDTTALEVWLREDHPDKAALMNSRVALSDLRELLSLHLAKMRCAAEWTHRKFEVDAPYLKPDQHYWCDFSELCRDYPELLRDAYIHRGLARAVHALMARWYLRPGAAQVPGAKQTLPHTFIKATDNEALARLLSAHWSAGDRFYADRDLLHPIIGDTCRERKVLIFSQPQQWANAPLSLVSSTSRTVVEQSPTASRLTETFANGLLRLPLIRSSEYLEYVRSHVAVLYLFEGGALFVEYRWNRHGVGGQRKRQAYAISGGTLHAQEINCPIEQLDEVDSLHQWRQVTVRELPAWGVRALSSPNEVVASV